MNRGYGMCGRWAVEVVRGSPSDVHALEPPRVVAPTVWVVESTTPALVLGSAQSSALVDTGAATRAGIDVVRRRSGGGAVLVDAGSTLWVDIIVPSGDAVWNDDVSRAPLWLGDVWAEVARGLGLAADVHSGPMQVDELARVVCFAGRAPGEVSVDGRKVLGISQRRTRGWARFQCALVLQWDPDGLIGLFTDLDEVDARRIHDTAVGVEVPRARVLAAFLSEIAHR